MIRVAVVLFAALTLLMIAGGVPLDGDAQSVVFRTPLFAFLLGLLGALLAAGCARYGRSWRRVSFWPAHLGALLILAGAGLGALLGVRGDLALPVGGWHAADRLPAAEGAVAPLLGFRLSVEDFKVDYYDPVYRLFQPRAEGPRSAGGYEWKGELAVTRGRALEIEGYGEVSPDGLWDGAASAWVQQATLTNGWILQCGRLTPKTYEAVLGIDRHGQKTTRALRVNRPVTVDGWRIYLMSYGTSPRPYAQLFLRRDPGRRLVIAGIWLAIAGTAWLCWGGAGRQRREGGGA